MSTWEFVELTMFTIFVKIGKKNEHAACTNVLIVMKYSKKHNSADVKAESGTFFPVLFLVGCQIIPSL